MMNNQLFPTASVKVNYGESSFEATLGEKGLIGLDLSLGEGEGSNSCKIQIHDANREITDALFTFVDNVQGFTPVSPPEDSETSERSNDTLASSDPSVNEKAWLDVIAYAEGTYGVGDNGYNQTFAYRTFRSYADHPRISITSGGYTSTAAGRYQFLNTTWDGLNLPDFSPQNQDKGALMLTERRGALGDVQAGNISSALQKCNKEWASFPGSPYGQPTKSEGELLNFFNRRVQAYKGTASPEPQKVTVTEEQPKTQKPYTPNGGQITITINGVAFTFIQTGVTFKENGRLLEIIGQSETFKLTQKLVNKNYTDVTLFQVCQEVCAKRGIQLDMVEDGVVYEFFPVRGKSLMKTIIREARRRGYRVTYLNGVLSVRKLADIPSKEVSYILKNGENAPLDISFSHKAESQGNSTGESASEPSKTNIAGEMRFVLDPTTGEIGETAEGKLLGTGENPLEIEGSPLPKEKPIYYDKAAEDEDAKARYDLTRLKGIDMSCTLPLDDVTVLLFPDGIVRTDGFGAFSPNQDPTQTPRGSALDRVWIINSVSHSISTSSYSTKISCSSPFKGKISND
jgi:muramidase (phage lysozyme)